MKQNHPASETPFPQTRTTDLVKFSIGQHSGCNQGPQVQPHAHPAWNYLDPHGCIVGIQSCQWRIWSVEGKWVK